MTRRRLGRIQLVAALALWLIACAGLNPCRMDPGPRPCPSDREEPMENSLINPVDWLSGAIAVRLAPITIGYASRVLARRAAELAAKKAAAMAAAVAKEAELAAIDAEGQVAAELIKKWGRSIDLLRPELTDPVPRSFTLDFYARFGARELTEEYGLIHSHIQGWEQFLAKAAGNRFIEDEERRIAHHAIDTMQESLRIIQEMLVERGARQIN